MKMKGFIEITRKDRRGDKELINLNNIRHVEYDGSNTVLNLDYQRSCSNYITCYESYEQIKKLIEGGL